MSQDTAKKTKWVVELVQGIMADHDAATEDEQTQHSAELVRSNRLSYFCVIREKAQHFSLILCKCATSCVIEVSSLS